MNSPRFIEELSARLNELFASSPARDLDRNVRALLGSAFARLDLVSREEFDVQAKVLERTRERLQALEARVGILEAKLRQ